MKEPTSRFIVLTSQRSGSLWLIDVLDHREGIRAFAELFLFPTRAKRKRAAAEGRTRGKGLMDSKTAQYVNERGYGYPRFLQSEEKEKYRRPKATFAYLDALFGHRPDAVGFKLMYSQLYRFPEILYYLWRNKVPIVHLVRENHLDVVISSARLRVTKVVHAIEGDQKPTGPVQVELEPKALMKRLKKLKRKMALARFMLKLFRLDYIEVRYEDLKDDPGRFRQIFEFLGFEPEGMPESRYKKLVRAGYADTISNYDEVSRVMKNSEFAYLLEESN